MDLSICVASFNTRDVLEKTLRAAIADCRDLEAEWIVVDNGSMDGSVAMIRAAFPQVRLIENAKNRFYAVASNQAVAAASGEYVLLLNSDAEVLPGTLQPLVGHLESHPEVAALTTRMYHPDGRLQRNCARFPSYALLLLDYTFLGRLQPDRRRRLRRWAWYADWDRTTERSVDVIPGSFILTRQGAIRSVGGFDEGLRLYFTEDDWCRRLQAAGLASRYVPIGGVIHAEGTSARTIRNLARRIYFEDLRRFTAKHYGKGRASLLWSLALPTRWGRIRRG